jgi:IPT/TIG domain/Repeat of unknown function (DUF346)
MRKPSRPGRLGLIVVLSVLLSSAGLAGTVMTAWAGAPMVSDINPKAGPNTGTSSVTIFGGGFQTGVTVTIGGVNAPVTGSTPNQITVNAPSVPGVFGALLVRAKNPDSMTSTQNLFYNYFEALPSGNATSAASVANPSQPARLDVFVKGTDNGLWHVSTANNDGVWSGWGGLGGVLSSAPSAVSWQDGQRIDVFARGSDNGLWHKWFDAGVWSGWEGLGGILRGAPVAVSWGPGRLDVFIRGTDNGLWHKWWDGSGWNGWEGLGGVLSSDPGGVSWGPPDRRVGPPPAHRIDLFVQGTDTGLWHKWFDADRWLGWEGLGAAPGGGLSFSPAAAATEVGDLDVFGLGPDTARALMHRPYFRSWLAWRAEGASYWTPSYWTYGVGAVSASYLQGVDVFTVAGNGSVWHTNLHGASENFGARPRPGRPAAH